MIVNGTIRYPKAWRFYAHKVPLKGLRSYQSTSRTRNSKYFEEFYLNNYNERALCTNWNMKKDISKLKMAQTFTWKMKFYS